MKFLRHCYKIKISLMFKETSFVTDRLLQIICHINSIRIPILIYNSKTQVPIYIPKEDWMVSIIIMIFRKTHLTMDTYRKTSLQLANKLPYFTRQVIVFCVNPTIIFHYERSGTRDDNGLNESTSVATANRFLYYSISQSGR